MLKTCKQHLFLIIALTVSSIPAAMVSGQESPVVTPSHGQTAVLIFISSETINDLILPVAEVRSIMTSTLHDHLSSHGHTLVSPLAVETAASHWRVRNDWSISGPFLDNLAADFGASLIQVVHLRAETSSLSLVTRLMECPSGRLLSVNNVTREAGADSTQWTSDLTALCQSLDPSIPNPGAAPPMILLPCEAVSCDSDHALMATTCILNQMLASNIWTITDPSVVNTTLSSAGVAPSRMGPMGFKLLRDTFQTEQIFHMRLLAYGDNVSSTTRTVIDDDPANGPTLQFGDFNLILNQIDLLDGTLVRSKDVFSTGKTALGWFGISHHRSTLDRITLAAEELWQAFNNNQKDH
jgi:hypothetical protein